MISLTRPISTSRPFSNVVIFRHTDRTIKPTCLLPLDDPDLHAKVKVSPGGVRFFKHRQYLAPTLPKTRKVRGEVTGFTKSSQRAFRDCLMRLDLAPFMADSKDVASNNGFFVSLDWPKDSDWTQETIYNDLERLTKKFKFRFKSSMLGAVWKKEVKGIGTPHLHVIVLFNEHLETQDLREWVRQAWTEITLAHDPFSTDVIPLYGEPIRLINYLLKPYSQVRETVNIGRIWGKWCVKTLPLVEPEILGLSAEDYPVFLDRLKGTPQAEHCKMIRDLTEKWKGGRVLGNGDLLRELLDDLPSDEIFKLWR